MEISTSILNATNRVESVLKLNRTNTSYIHVDVMDGKFVSDTQFKINEISAINRVTKYPLDIHLMVNDPIKYVLEFENMNIEYVTFHLEIRRSKEKIISKIKKMGYKVGISIKPDTDINKLIPYLKDIDLVLVMSVEPGKGGQEFLKTTVDRVNEVKKLIDDKEYDIKIEVDGGINDKTISKLQNVDIAVVGSYVIKSDNYYRQIEKLLNLVENTSNKNAKVNSTVISNFLIVSSLLVIFSAFCMELGKTFNLFELINAHPFVYFVGFLGLSFGLFMRPIFKSDINKVDKMNKEYVLKRERLLYSVLLGIGIMFALGLLFYCLYDCLIAGFDIELFVLEIVVYLISFWPIALLGILFIVVGIVRLNEIKRLSE